MKKNKSFTSFENLDRMGTWRSEVGGDLAESPARHKSAEITDAKVGRHMSGDIDGGIGDADDVAIDILVDVAVMTLVIVVEGSDLEI